MSKSSVKLLDIFLPELRLWRQPSMDISMSLWLLPLRSGSHLNRRSSCFRYKSLRRPGHSSLPLHASGVSILSEEHGNICRQLAGKDKSARFSGIATTTTDQGAVLIHNSSAWFECSVFDQHPAGDHDVVFLEIHGLRANPAASPLVFHGSRSRALAA